MDRYLGSFLLWGGWLLLPIIVDIIKNVILIAKLSFKLKKSKVEELHYRPIVTLLIPVYNSSKTLRMCLDSLLTQSYGVENLEVFLINNGDRKDSYSIFQDFQMSNSKLKIWWLDSSKGKASALNKGLFNSTGNYIINIDSDGWLHEDAIRNIIKKFNKEKDAMALTGVVLTDPLQIEDTKPLGLRLLQKAEFVEYCEAFLIGRNHQSETNTLYTLAGAFSAFRKEAILKTQLYNSQTLGEDTHMTFQIRKFIGGKILLCEDAFLFVDPIESINKLYMQRQRWQRSTMEIAMMFKDFHTGKFTDIFKKSSMRLLISDHTLAFVNLFWTFSFIYFYYVGYPIKYFVIANGILIIFYSLNSMIYNIVSRKFMKSITLTRDYLKKHWWVSFLMVPYRSMTYLIRIAGLINSLTTEATWNPKTLNDEMTSLKKSFRFSNK